MIGADTTRSGAGKEQPITFLESHSFDTFIHHAGRIAISDEFSALPQPTAVRRF